MDLSSRLSTLSSRVASISLALLTLSAATAHAASEGERCGRIGSWSDSCDKGFECSIRWSFWHWEVGICTAAELACGARLGDTCAEDEFCSFAPAAICGFADGTGVCEPRPEFCTEEWNPVCGCNGETFGNACAANAAGVSVQASGECPPVSECQSDQECPFGYCDIGVTCAAIGCPPPPPNRCTVCGDGTGLLCRRAVPVCPDGLVPEIVNNCFGACVDRYTCEPKVACYYSDPTTHWVSKDPEECTRIDFQCPDGEEQFTDECGCGCQT